MGAVAATVHYAFVRIMPTHPGDFGLSWFGARSLMRGINPYELVGPGLTYDWPWPLVYPATAFVAVMPLAVLPQVAATLVFVFVSCGLLAYSVTRDNWARTPMFASVSFLVAAAVAQWSPLFTAAMGIPVLGLFFAAKPTLGLALGAAGCKRLQQFAIGGGVVLVIISVALFPEWPRIWLGQLHYATQMAAPVARFGGAAILLVLLRWRRPEARLIAFLACVPQVGSWYDTLPLFLVPATLSESMLLVCVSSLGWVFRDQLWMTRTELELNQQWGALIVASAYLPAVIMVLRRPNEGPLPGWLVKPASFLRRARQGRQPSSI
jgi:hypothetical protein